MEIGALALPELWLNTLNDSRTADIASKLLSLAALQTKQLKVQSSSNDSCWPMALSSSSNNFRRFDLWYKCSLCT